MEQVQAKCETIKEGVQVSGQKLQTTGLDKKNSGDKMRLTSRDAKRSHHEHLSKRQQGNSGLMRSRHGGCEKDIQRWITSLRWPTWWRRNFYLMSVQWTVSRWLKKTEANVLSLTLWSCTSGTGAGEGTFITSTVSAQMYTNFWSLFNNNNNNLKKGLVIDIFQYVNASYHSTAKHSNISSGNQIAMTRPANSRFQSDSKLKMELLLCF